MKKPKYILYNGAGYGDQASVYHTKSDLWDEINEVIDSDNESLRLLEDNLDMNYSEFKSMYKDLKAYEVGKEVKIDFKTMFYALVEEENKRLEQMRKWEEKAEKDRLERNLEEAKRLADSLGYVLVEKDAAE